MELLERAALHGRSVGVVAPRLAFKAGDLIEVGLQCCARHSLLPRQRWGADLLPGEVRVVDAVVRADGDVTLRMSSPTWAMTMGQLLTRDAVGASATASSSLRFGRGHLLLEDGGASRGQTVLEGVLEIHDDDDGRQPGTVHFPAAPVPRRTSAANGHRTPSLSCPGLRPGPSACPRAAPSRAPTDERVASDMEGGKDRQIAAAAVRGRDEAGVEGAQATVNGKRGGRHRD
ncbi:unnamed protein product [Urochloa humidicola]